MVWISTFHERDDKSKKQHERILPIYEKFFNVLRNDIEFITDEVIQKKGIDVIIRTWKWDILIEEKHRDGKYAYYSDFFLETESCSIPWREKIGWIYTWISQYLLYCFHREKENEVYSYIFDFPKLKEWFKEQDIKRFQERQTNEINRTRWRIVTLEQIKESHSLIKILRTTF